MRLIGVNSHQNLRMGGYDSVLLNRGAFLLQFVEFDERGPRRSRLSPRISSTSNVRKSKFDFLEKMYSRAGVGKKPSMD